MRDDGVVVVTDRLVVRRLRAEDAAAIAHYRSDADVARMQSWTTPYPVASARALIEDVAGHELGAPGWTQLGIELAAGGELIGDLGVNGLDGTTVELGVTLAQPHWGKGYATEAGAAVIAHLLGPLGFHVVVASADPGNTRSRALLERLGLVLVEETATDAHYAHTVVDPTFEAEAS